MDIRLQQFNGKPFLNLESFRKNGESMKTPVWFTQADDVIYVRTVANSGKVKRIRHNRNIRIVPCEANGSPTWQWVTAQAVEVSEQETVGLVAQWLEEKYGAERVRQFATATAAQGRAYTIIKIVSV